MSVGLYFCAQDCCFLSLKPGVHKSWVPGCPGDYILCCGSHCYAFSLWNLLDVAHLAPRILRWLENLGNLCTPFFKHCNLEVCGCCSSFAVCPICYHRFSYNCYLSSLRIGLRIRMQKGWLGQHVNHKTVAEKNC